MISLQDSEAAFDKYKLKTKAQVDPDKFEGLATEIMGIKTPSPIWISSTAFHRMAHPDGEAATARAANTSATPFMLSSWSNTPLEVVANECPNSLKMFQIYMSKVPEVNEDLWKRVRESGYKIMFLTTDTQLLGKREQDMRNGF
jgi:(S)-2-hydroxy-acid oxidase